MTLTEPLQGLESLVVWKKTSQFALKICKDIVTKLPDCEKYALSSQLRRSSQSIAANIAEGYGRYYYQEGVHFSYIARGSLEETYNHLVYAKGMRYLSDSDFSELFQDLQEIRKLIDGYVIYLKRSKRGINEPGASYDINQPVTPDSDFV